MKKYQITEWCHHFIGGHVLEGDICIDATAGNGHDTLLLAELVGASGSVIAFDIQEQAVQETKRKIDACGYAERTEVVLDSHVHMGAYAKENTVSCITFNFGYLPGGSYTCDKGRYECAGDRGRIATIEERWVDESLHL